ncbi:oligosaccharide flippase family protein [Rhodocytophaga rosea]|uniref:Oligosaccharide flippase family protein n=1 Tax=Rhodocytophaga rosea TaxID=2704465 RepID=A0A6C0GRC9_9BACT|nr:polysaccharide biosynthesis C-terminal domain-containing protein [Rhodocytophaga rosea]QHT70487.1 oligosaccharide flippase family protein [Rhodocytophaga rosea]
MGIIVRQGLKYSTIAFLGVVIGAVNTIIIFPKILSPEQYGLMRLIQENGLFIAAFVQLGAANIADKFIPIFQTHDKTNRGFLFFLLIYPLMGFIFFCLIYLLFKNTWLDIYLEKSPGVNTYYYFFIPLIFFMMYQLILEAYSRVHLRIVVPGLFRDVVLKIITLGFAGLFFLHFISFYQFMLLLIIAYGIIAILLLLYLHNLKILHLKPDIDFLTLKLLKEMGIYAAFMLLGGAATLIITKIDFLMLGAMVGPESVAIYTIAFFMGTIIEIPRRAIAQISTPILSQAWQRNDLPQIEDIYKRSALNQLIIGSLLFLGIWCNTDAVFNLIPNGEIYRAGKYVVLFIGLARLFDMATGVNGEIILQSRYFRFNLISVAILAILIVGTNFIFIPLYGINGAAFATALSVFLYNILKFMFLWIKYRIQPFSHQTIYILLITGFTYVAAALLPAPEPALISSFTNIVLRSAIISILFGGLILGLGISKDANLLLKTGYQKLRTLFG